MLRKSLLFTIISPLFLLVSCTQNNNTNSETIITNNEVDHQLHGTVISSGALHATSHSTRDGKMYVGIQSEEEFIANMIPHHQEAIDTSQTILIKSENEDLKRIASSIIESQSKEIFTLRGWLANWYPNTKIRGIHAPMMRDLSPLAEIDVDHAYIEDMIKHHEGAIEMAQEVLKVSKRPEILKIANDIIRTQKEEIEAFKKLLSTH